MPLCGMRLHRGNALAFAAKMPSLFLGLFLFAAGSVASLNSRLGMSPWGVFHVGLTAPLGLTLGQVSQLVGLAVLLGGWALGFAPGFGTVMNMFFIGWFTDRIIEWRLLPTPTDPLGQFGLLAASVLFVGAGSLFYLRVQLGAGPRDGFMVGLVRKLDKPVWIVRGCMEVSVLIMGYLLGGPVGAGTVVTALTLGYSVQAFFRLGGFEGKSSQMNLWELYRHLTEVR